MDESFGSDVVHVGAYFIPVGALFFHAEDDGSAVVAVFVGGVGGGEVYGKVFLLNSLGDLFPPVGMDFACTGHTVTARSSERYSYLH